MADNQNQVSQNDWRRRDRDCPPCRCEHDHRDDRRDNRDNRRDNRDNRRDNRDNRRDNRDDQRDNRRY